MKIMEVPSFKHLGTTMIIAFFIFIAFGSNETMFWLDISSEFRKVDDVQKAEQLAEKYLAQYQSDYNDLCGEARNRQLREKFLALEKKVAELPSVAEKCEKLDYDKQRMLRNYIENSIKSKSNLNNLIEGRIECWE